MQPVSSPTNASHTRCGAPSLPAAMLRTSLFDIVFAMTFTALDVGVNSPTFASTGSLRLEKPSTAKLIQHLIYVNNTDNIAIHLSLLVQIPAFKCMPLLADIFLQLLFTFTDSRTPKS